jgi:nucleoside-diphosphate-sugar epimerase
VSRPVHGGALSPGLSVLLIGGAGYMGRPTARAMLEAGHRVTVLSRGMRPAVEGAEHLGVDRRDPTALATALEGRRFDFTVDFVAYDAADVERLLLVPYAALGRYVMISSGQVYLVTVGATPPFREEESGHPLMPEPPAGTPDHREWSYGVGKRRAERVLLKLRATHGVRGLALRLPVVQGEGDPYARLSPYLERMMDGGPVLLPADGATPTRYIYVGDVARALVRLLEGSPPRSPVYNLAQPEVLPLREFLERVARTAGLKPRFVGISWEELAAVGLDRSVSPLSGPWCSVPDPSRACSEWGFIGSGVEEYLPRVVRWHLEHRPATSHPGYARRAIELEWAARHAAAG